MSTILIVEDEPVLMERVKAILAQAPRYEALFAETYGEGKAIATSFPQEIHLLLSNVVLDPGANGDRELGSDLAAELKVARPGMKVILLDGKACGEMSILQRARQGWELVEDPFIGDTLITRIRAELGGPMAVGG